MSASPAPMMPELRWHVVDGACKAGSILSGSVESRSVIARRLAGFNFVADFAVSSIGSVFARR